MVQDGYRWIEERKDYGYGWGYEVQLSPDEKYIAYRYSFTNKPWELYVQENAPGKKPIQVTDKGMSDAFKAYPWRAATVTTFTARDGAQVYTRVYEPAAGKKMARQ